MKVTFYENSITDAIVSSDLLPHLEEFGVEVIYTIPNRPFKDDDYFVRVRHLVLVPIMRSLEISHGVEITGLE